MNALTRLNRFEDLFSDMTRRFMRPENLSGLGADAPGEIRVDVSETDRDCEVRAQVLKIQ